MKVSIEYCAQWRYEPQAAGLAAELGKLFPEAEITLMPSAGGAFEVTVDGQRIFSKLELGRFPAYREIPGLIQ